MDMSKSGNNSVSPENIRSEVGRNRNFYDVLGVSPDVSSTGVREAYFRLKNTYTKSNQALYSLIADDEVDETVGEIERAYETLINAHHRHVYDKENNINSKKPEQESVAMGVNDMSFHSKDVERINFIREQTSIRHEMNRAPNEGAFFKPSKAVKGKRISRISPVVKDTRYIEKVKSILEGAEEFSGSLLKEIREFANITAAEVQENTKISLGVIQSIEEERFETMPQVSYAKGFMLSYLVYLGIPDAKEVTTSFIGRYEAWKNDQNQ